MLDSLIHKFGGMKFVLSANSNEKEFQVGLSNLLRNLGAEVDCDVTANTTFVVTNSPQNRLIKEAKKLNQAGASIKFLNYEALASMVKLTSEELLEAVKELPGTFLADYLRFHKADFSGSNLKSTTLESTQFHDSIEIDGVDFSDSTLKSVGIQYKYAPVKGLNVARSHIIDCRMGRMKSCSFEGAKIEQLLLTDGSNVEECDFRAVEFQSSTCKNVLFNNCDLRGANFDHRCSLLKTDFTNCEMSDVTMNGVQFQHCSFRGSNLENSNFAQASLADVTFEGSNLSTAKFSGALLIDTDFSKATIDGAVFSDTIVIRAKFDPSQPLKCLGLTEAIEKEWNPCGPHHQVWERALDTQASLDSPWEITFTLLNAWRIFERFTITPSVLDRIVRCAYVVRDGLCAYPLLLTSKQRIFSITAEAYFLCWHSLQPNWVGCKNSKGLKSTSIRSNAHSAILQSQQKMRQTSP